MSEHEKTTISSAELTANYRCAFPEISGDTVSSLLSSEQGKKLAEDFIARYNYPLVQRKISACAGYFLKEVTRLIQTGHYDAIISFASGLSLLTYRIAQENPNFEGDFLDTDLDYMINERNKRIKNVVSSALDLDIVKKLHTKTFDIEQAYREGVPLKEVFSQYKKPIFILDGVSYFLSYECVNWFIEQIGDYRYSAFSLYYWPSDMFEQSQLFSTVFKDLNKTMIKEELRSFWDRKTIEKVKSYFDVVKDQSLAEVELDLVKDPTQCQLLDANYFFPVRLLTAENSNRKA